MNNSPQDAQQSVEKTISPLAPIVRYKQRLGNHPNHLANHLYSTVVPRSLNKKHPSDLTNKDAQEVNDQL